MDLLGRLTRADSRAGSAACRETKGTDGRGLPCVGHPHGGRCASFLIRILTPGFGASQGLGGGQAPRAGLLTLTPPHSRGAPQPVENPPPHLQGPGLLILTPQLRRLPAPELMRIHCIAPQREGSCGLNSPRSLTLLRRLLRAQRQEPLAIAGPQPDPSGSTAPGAYLFKFTQMNMQMY